MMFHWLLLFFKHVKHKAIPKPSPKHNASLPISLSTNFCRVQIKFTTPTFESTFKNLTNLKMTLHIQTCAISKRLKLQQWAWLQMKALSMKLIYL